MEKNAVGLLICIILLGCARSPDEITLARAKADEACKDRGGAKIVDVAKRQAHCRDNTKLSFAP